MGDNNGVELIVERLTGRVLVIEGRIAKAEQLLDEVKEFQVETRENWNQFLGSQRAMEKMQGARHAENRERMGRISNHIGMWGAVIALLGLVCAGAMLFLAIRAATHAQNDPAKIFHSSKAAPAYAKDKENLDSKIPSLYASWR